MTYNQRQFSQNTNEEIVLEQTGPEISKGEKMEFKAETKKLLKIVAKSIYTDKEVHLYIK